MDVAKDEFCEATLSPPDNDPATINTLNNLFQADHFKVSLCYDTPTVEMCGALKNVVACGAGLIDGLGLGINTKSAAICCGLKVNLSFLKSKFQNFPIGKHSIC